MTTDFLATADWDEIYAEDTKVNGGKDKDAPKPETKLAGGRIRAPMI